MIGLEYILKISEVEHKQLAEELGIKKQNINLWLSGKQNISKKYLSLLSEKFNQPEDYFQIEINKALKIEILKNHICYLERC